MKKSKKVATIIICLAVLIFTIGYGTYYYLYNVVQVNDYYAIKIYEPERSLFGFWEAPKIEIKKMKDFDNDKEAIKAISKAVKKEKKVYEYMSEVYASNKTEDKVMIQLALKELAASHYLISIKHVRSFSNEEVLKVLKECKGNFSKLAEYAQTKKVEYHEYPIY